MFKNQNFSNMLLSI